MWTQTNHGSAWSGREPISRRDRKPKRQGHRGWQLREYHAGEQNNCRKPNATFDTDSPPARASTALGFCSSLDDAEPLTNASRRVFLSVALAFSENVRSAHARRLRHMHRHPGCGRVISSILE